MANRASLYNWADERLKGQLRPTLLAWRDQGLTLDQIARRLDDDHDLGISRETVRRWLKDAA